MIKLGMQLFSGTVMALATPVLAKDRLNWTPKTYAEFEATIIASANTEKQPIHGLTIGPKKFAEEVDGGYVEYLALVRVPFNLSGAPDGVKEAFVRQEYFRDQMTSTGSAIDGTKSEATYRSVQKAYVINCPARAIANNGFTRFERNETEGSALYFEEGTTDYSKLNITTAVERSVGASVISSVCDGKYIYAPKT